MRIIVGNNPRSYREALAAAFAELCRSVEVYSVEPEKLDTEVQRLTPEMVVCSSVTSTIMQYPLTWVMLYPEGSSHVEVNVAGRRSSLDDIELSGLLSIINETAVLAEAT